MSDSVSTVTSQITLASASPRRAELLEQIQVTYEIFPVNIDESHHVGETADVFVKRLALEKAQAGFTAISHQPSLGSDTIVVIDEKILGKPSSQQHAREMLTLLSGKTHQVMTAVAICSDNRQACLLSISEVELACLTEQQIEIYIQTDEPQGKAGSYAIQGIAAQFIKNIKGSYSGIMGLPLYETTQLLKQVGIKGISINS